MKKRWTDEKLAELFYLSENCTIKQVAAYYKVTVCRISQVKAWAKRRRSGAGSTGEMK